MILTGSSQASSLKTLWSLGVVLALLGCGERKAIETVHRARVGVGLASETWKELVERNAAKESTAQDWSWSADQDRPGLESGEWFVRYINKSGAGYFWIARPDTGAVIFINDDRLAAFRVGNFVAHSENIEISITEEGFFSCGTPEAKAYCYHLVGTATNVNQPLVKAEPKMGLVIKVGDRTEEGRNWFRLEKPLPTISEQRPWEKGETFAFDYWSKAIPEVFARQEGNALVFLEMTTSSLTWSEVGTPVFVSMLSWPPKPRGPDAIPQVPRMKPPDFASDSKYRFELSQVEAFCREEWTKRGELDRSMFNYCVRRQRDGHVAMLAALKKFGANDWIASLFPTIWNRYTEKGHTNYTMVAFSLEKQGDAFLDYEFARKEASYDGARMSDCEEKWLEHESRWSMTMHCYKQ